MPVYTSSPTPTSQPLAVIIPLLIQPRLRHLRKRGRARRDNHAQVLAHSEESQLGIVREAVSARQRLGVRFGGVG